MGKGGKGIKYLTKLDTAQSFLRLAVKNSQTTVDAGRHIVKYNENAGELGAALFRPRNELRHLVNTGYLDELLAPGRTAPRGPLRADEDVLRDVFGPARLSHADEYADTLARLQRSGVEVVFRSGHLAYSPRPGGPGRLILDPDASIGALRHEVRHFDDIAEGGYKGLAHYYDNLDEFWRLEYRGYMEEINLGRQARQFDAGREILRQMRARRQELLGY